MNRVNISRVSVAGDRNMSGFGPQEAEFVGSHWYFQSFNMTHKHCALKVTPQKRHDIITKRLQFVDRLDLLRLSYLTVYAA